LASGAPLLGSVNVMRRLADGRWDGDNLDGLGYLDGIAREGFSMAGSRRCWSGRAAQVPRSRSKYWSAGRRGSPSTTPTLAAAIGWSPSWWDASPAGRKSGARTRRPLT
jgi:hypothetical protein